MKKEAAKKLLESINQIHMGPMPTVGKLDTPKPHQQKADDEIETEVKEELLENASMLLGIYKDLIIKKGK